MRTFDLAPLYRSTVGFDRLFSMLDGFEAAPGYPPYNIERTGENAYRISVAVAGFGENELSIEAKENTLTIKGEKQVKDEKNSGEVLYQGIAARAFERVFQLADYVQVKGAALENGLLHVDLVREIPEAKKPRQIRSATVSPRWSRPKLRNTAGQLPEVSLASRSMDRRERPGFRGAFTLRPQRSRSLMLLDRRRRRAGGRRDSRPWLLLVLCRPCDGGLVTARLVTSRLATAQLAVPRRARDGGGRLRQLGSRPRQRRAPGCAAEWTARRRRRRVIQAPAAARRPGPVIGEPSTPGGGTSASWGCGRAAVRKRRQDGVARPRAPVRPGGCGRAGHPR